MRKTEQTACRAGLLQAEATGSGRVGPGDRMGATPEGRVARGGRAGWPIAAVVRTRQVAHMTETHAPKDALSRCTGGDRGMR